MLTRRTFLQLIGASTGVALTGSEFLSQAVANTAAALSPQGSNGVEHVVVLMMENRSFDHFLGWLPGAKGRTDMTFLATDGNIYPNYPLAPDFQGCGYGDPDHSWEGWLVEYNFGKMDGFLQRPTALDLNPGVTAAAANTFPIGYYTNLNADGTAKAVPDLPVLGALARNYTTLDHYFCSFAGETFPNRMYQHAARTDRDHNITTISALPTIWDQLSPVPNNQGIPTGGYFFRDLPFLALWGLKYYPFWHLYAGGDTDVLGIPVNTLPFLDTVAQGLLPNVSFVDPEFALADDGTGADDHPKADIRRGERFIADTYHALAAAGYLDNTVLVITFDEWGGFFDHVRPPQVIDDTDPATVDHTGNSTTPTDGRLVPDYTQLGFRVPAIVVSNLAAARVAHSGPFEHTSTLKMIESTFGLHPLTARDANAMDLRQVLNRKVRQPVPESAIPTSSQVPGPADDAAAFCSATSTQSTSPAPVSKGKKSAAAPVPPQSGYPTGTGMAGLARHYQKQTAK
ncbi:MAG TPA: alkaline phosphatase family protein [Streptosporangiaceae bacterium]|nr:alkaline phosphatase family protein [Streptosporangiaceae bacterium]